MIPLNTSIVAGVALSEIDGQTKMLLMKRVKGGYWCHVAGSIEAGETGWQAIVREFEEETKIEAKALYNAQFLEQFYEANVNVIQLIPIFAVLCPPNQAVELNHEHTEYRWCSLEEAKALAPFPNQHAVYEHIFSYFVDKPANPLYRVKVD
ncbi:Nudix hydrolase domain-containing protein [Vibrio chagasii]|nr:Nudix hydrolase domain-containing protein [Vibrio chagasii]CAH6921822.1 Nudix hydrolase domain-containing protein [Vibrio chagasii]CAH7264459.1 Nudix hydrolase domain-containing protein [Vibrio chagasii]CAH7375992.1 Nudix hydrolase domain-containing protein [Vibrio chagasii]CAH7398482.1 Nudix hydrolase domain-containing protein [Vibrio chagasii]